MDRLLGGPRQHLTHRRGLQPADLAQLVGGVVADALADVGRTVGDLDRVVTTGFSKMSERQIGLWDTRNPTQAISIDPLDSSSGVGMPFWDDGCKMLYIAGKGDGNIKYFEFENDKSRERGTISLFG